MSNPLEALSRADGTLGRTDDGGDAFDGLKRVQDAAAEAASDPTRLDTLTATGDREARRLTKLLTARARAAEAAADAAFASVPPVNGEKWSAWWEAIGTHGNDSEPAKKARDAYLSALLNYDCELRARLLDCAALTEEAGRRASLHASLADLEKIAEKQCTAAIRTAGESAPSRFAAQRMVQRLQTVRTTALRLQKAHGRMAALAAEEERRIARIKKTNDTWIADFRARNLGDALKAALAALGIEA